MDAARFACTVSLWYKRKTLQRRNRKKSVTNSLWNPRRVLCLFVCIALHLLVSSVYAAPAVQPLAVPPLGERWFSISMNGGKVGFAHTQMTATPEGFRITAEGSAKMLVLGFSREAASRERYDVNRDLTLRSFEVEQTIDGSPLHLSGSVHGSTIRVAVTSKGGKSEKTLSAKGAVYPSAVINLYPLMKGFSPGRKYSMQILDVESVKVREVIITGIGFETRNARETLHFQNNLYSFVDNDIWLDRFGNTLEESVRDGLIVTKAEDPALAARSLLDDVVAKKDLVLDFSLVRIDREIPDPRGVKRLVMDISGYPANLPLPEGPGQTSSRLVTGIRVAMTAPLRSSADLPLTAAETVGYLSATPRINADHPEIVSRQKELLVTTPTAEQSVTTLAHWVAGHLDDTVRDSTSAVEALHLRTGNCQSHARLYIALARAAGIPTRFVSGLVHAKGKGFLYHSWAESYVNGWIAVDPTFAQAPADATHLRLVEGDEPDEMAPLAGIIGRIKARVVEIHP